MNIWKILAIPRTNDVREIKKAYAKKLKVTRPDEHPEKFQELHTAYKIAIDQAKYQWENTENLYEEDGDFYNEDSAHESSAQENNIYDNESLAADSISIQKNDSPENDSPEVEDKHQIEINQLVEKAQNLLNTETQLYEIEAWHFLLDSPHILDSDFNWRLGIAILQLLGEHNSKIYTHQIKSDLISYLNNIFNWDANRDYIDSLLGSDVIADLLNNISEGYNAKQLSGIRGSTSITLEKPSMHQLPVMPYATKVMRFFAFSVDALILTSLFLLLLLTPLFDIELIHVGYFTALILLISAAYFFFFEVSSFNASPGKIVFGLVVVNQNYESISIFQALLRTGLLFLGISIFVSLVFYARSGFHLGVSFGLCFLVLRMLIFICTAPEERILLNDMFSKTFVFDLRKAQREHSSQL